MNIDKDGDINMNYVIPTQKSDDDISTKSDEIIKRNVTINKNNTSNHNSTVLIQQKESVPITSILKKQSKHHNHLFMMYTLIVSSVFIIFALIMYSKSNNNMMKLKSLIDDKKNLTQLYNIDKMHHLKKLSVAEILEFESRDIINIDKLETRFKNHIMERTISLQQLYIDRNESLIIFSEFGLDKSFKHHNEKLTTKIYNKLFKGFNYLSFRSITKAYNLCIIGITKDIIESHVIEIKKNVTESNIIHPKYILVQYDHVFEFDDKKEVRTVVEYLDGDYTRNIAYIFKLMKNNCIVNDVKTSSYYDLLYNCCYY